MITATPSLGMIKLTDSTTGQVKFVSPSQATQMGIQIPTQGTNLNAALNNQGGSFNPTGLLPAAGGIAGLVGGGILGDVPGAVAGGSAGQGAGQALEDWINQNVLHTQKPQSVSNELGNIGSSALQGGLYGLLPADLGATSLIGRAGVGAGIGAGTAALQAQQQGQTPQQGLQSSETNAALLGGLNAILPGLGALGSKLGKSGQSTIDALKAAEQPDIEQAQAGIKQLVGANTDAFDVPNSLKDATGNIKQGITYDDLKPIYQDYSDMYNSNKALITDTLGDMSQYAPTHAGQDVLTELNDAIDESPSEDRQTLQLKTLVNKTLGDLQGNDMQSQISKLNTPGVTAGFHSPGSQPLKQLTIQDLQELKDRVAGIYPRNGEQNVVTKFYSKINNLIKRDLDTAEKKATGAVDSEGVPYQAVRQSYEKLNESNQALGQSKNDLYDLIHNTKKGIPAKLQPANIQRQIKAAKVVAARNTPLMNALKNTKLPLDIAGFMTLKFIGYIMGSQASSVLERMAESPEAQIKVANALKSIHDALTRVNAYRTLQNTLEQGATAASVNQ